MTIHSFAEAQRIREQRRLAEDLERHDAAIALLHRDRAALAQMQNDQQLKLALDDAGTG